MMPTTLKQLEAAPVDYPDVPSGLSTEAKALNSDMIWQRLESYVAYRWTPRDVVWIVEGCGEWKPPLWPATVDTVEVWSRGAFEWEETTLDPSPLGGYYLPATGPYRFTASVGATSDAPANVNEAFRRLAEYFAAETGTAGARSESIHAGTIRHDVSRDPAWMASAMQNSGAADLLRNYRHV
jgi:hypothetical protein